MDLSFGGKENQRKETIVRIATRDALSTSMCFALPGSFALQNGYPCRFVVAPAHPAPATLVHPCTSTELKNDPAEKRQQ